LGFSGEFDCPYSAISQMLRLLPTRHPDEPSFNFGPGRPLRRSEFISAIRSTLTIAGLADGIHGHSFRIGGATILAAAGYPDHVIKFAGRWTSDAYLTYIRRQQQFLPQTVAAIAKLPFPADWELKKRSLSRSRPRGVGW
jgi:hypothetical protein